MELNTEKEILNQRVFIKNEIPICDVIQTSQITKCILSELSLPKRVQTYWREATNIHDISNAKTSFIVWFSV